MKQTNSSVLHRKEKRHVFKMSDAVFPNRMATPHAFIRSISAIFFCKKKYNYSNLYINQIKLLQKLFKVITYKKDKSGSWNGTSNVD